MDNAELLTTAEVAEILKITEPVLGNWRSAGRGPRFLKLTEGQRGRVRYRAADVVAFIDTRTSGGESQPADAGIGHDR